MGVNELRTSATIEETRQCTYSLPARLICQERVRYSSTMTDAANLALLVCASVGALAFGVFAGLLVLRAVFACMLPNVRRAAPKSLAKPAPAVSN